MRYPFQAAANLFLDAYSGVYSAAMHSELQRRYPKIGRQLIALWEKGKITTTNPAKLTAEDIKAYTVYLRQRGLAITSIQHDVGSLSMLCMYVAGNACVQEARVRYPLLYPKRPTKRLPVLERPQVDKILRAANTLTVESDPLRIRAYAETIFAIGMGARTQEIMHAKVEYLLPDLSAIFLDHVKGQGSYGQCRTAPIRPECRPTLELWLRVRSPSSSPYLFPNPQGRPQVLQTLTRHRSMVIVETGVTYDYRMCRRTYAQYLVDEGYPTDKVAVVLGHTSAKTTESAYAKPRSDRVVAEIIYNWSEQNESI